MTFGVKPPIASNHQTYMLQLIHIQPTHDVYMMVDSNKNKLAEQYKCFVSFQLA